jgi:hypothetical protein
MTSNTNISSDQVDNELYEELLYKLLLYKKKDIIAIQEKLSIAPLGPINDNTNKTALNKSKGKILKNSFRLFFDLVEELAQIAQIKEGSNAYILPILSILHRNKQFLIEVTCEEETMLLGEMYHLLLYLEWDISLIHGNLGIIGHTNSEISGLETEKNARAYLQKFRRSIRSSAPKIEPKVENIPPECELLPTLLVELEEKRFHKVLFWLKNQSTT